MNNNMIVDNSKAQYGYLHVIIACMFAGKSSELIRLKKRAYFANKKCLMIKYKNDNRYTKDAVIVTHDNITEKAVIAVDDKLLSETIKSIEDLEQYQCIFIDEVQFYKDADVVCDQLANAGYQVIVCGLKADYNDNPFGRMPWLIAKADDITYLKAICQETGEDAAFTAKISDDKNIIDIGGIDKYKAVSRNGKKRLKLDIS